MIGKVVGLHPDIPQGKYTVKYCGYETGQSWNGPKVKVNFAVVEGDYSGILLPRYYNARRTYDPIGPDGDFDVGDRGHLVKEYRSLLPDVRSISDIDLNNYKDKVILARVETVNRTGTGEKLEVSNQYAIIRKLIEIIPDSYYTETTPKLG